MADGEDVVTDDVTDVVTDVVTEAAVETVTPSTAETSNDDGGVLRMGPDGQNAQEPDGDDGAGKSDELDETKRTEGSKGMHIEGVPDKYVAEAMLAYTGGPEMNKRERGATVPVRVSKKKKQRNLDKYLQAAFGVSAKQHYANLARQKDNRTVFKEVLGKKTHDDERRAAVLEFGRFKHPFVTRENPIMPPVVKIDADTEHPVTLAQMRGALGDLSRPLLHLQYVVAYLLHHGKLAPRKYKNFQLLRDTEGSQGKDILLQKILSEPPERIAEMYDLIGRVDSEIMARTKRVPQDKIKAYDKWKRNEHVFLNNKKGDDEISKTKAASYTSAKAPYHYIPRDPVNFLMAKMAGRDDSRLYIHRPKWLLGGRWEDPELKKEWEEQLRKVEQQKKAAKKQTKRNNDGVDTYEDDDTPFVVLNDDDDGDDDDGNGTGDEGPDGPDGPDGADGKKKKNKRKRKGRGKGGGKKKKDGKKPALTEEERLAEIKKQFGDMEDLCGKGMDEFLNWASEAALYMHESNIDQYEMDLARLMRLRQHHCPAPIHQLDTLRAQMKTAEHAADVEAQAERDAFIHDRRMTHKMKEQFKKMAMEKEGGPIDEAALDAQLDLLDGETIIDVDKLRAQGYVEGVDYIMTGKHAAGKFFSKEEETKTKDDDASDADPSSSPA